MIYNFKIAFVERKKEVTESDNSNNTSDESDGDRISTISTENPGSASKGKMGKGKLFLIAKICRWNKCFFFVCKSFYLFINVLHIKRSRQLP